MRPTRQTDPDASLLPEPGLAGTLYEQYVWSQRYIDAPVLRDRDADADPATGDLGLGGSGLEERLYYLTDVNMNVRSLVDTNDDAVERYAYDPYGRATILHGAYGTDSEVDNSSVCEWDEDTSGTDVANEILFCGYRLNPETGLYHVRNRDYHPTLGRWLQRDPLGYVDGMSLYEYVGSAPISDTDALGLAKVLTKSAGKKKKEVVHSAIVVDTKQGKKVLSWEKGGWKIIDYKYYKEKMYPDRTIFETEVFDDTGKSLDDNAILIDVAKSKETDYDLTEKNCAQQTHRVLAKHGMNPAIQERVLPEQLHKDTLQMWGGETTQVGKQSDSK